MASIDCPVPRTLTYKEVRDAYNAARKKYPDLPGVSGHRREAARMLGVDYKYYMDIFTKRIPSGTPPAANLIGRVAVAKAPAAKKVAAAAKKPRYKGEWVTNYDEFGDDAFVMIVDGRKIGHITRKPIGFSEETGETLWDYVIHRPGSSQGVGGFGNLWTAQRSLVMQYGDPDDIARAARALIANMGDDMPKALMGSAPGKYQFAVGPKDLKLGRGIDAIPDRFKDDIVKTFQDQSKYAGKYVSNEFRGVVKFKGNAENAIAHYVSFDRNIAFNPKYTGLAREEMARTAASAKRLNWTYQNHGDVFESTVAHEFGHHVEYSIRNYTPKKPLPMGGQVLEPFDVEQMLDDVFAWKTEVHAAKIIEEDMYRDIIDSITKSFPDRQSYSLTMKQALDRVEQSGTRIGLDNFLRDFATVDDFSLSGASTVHKVNGRYVRGVWDGKFTAYSATNAGEFFAEAWAQYTMNPSAPMHINRIGSTIQRTIWKLERLRGIT